MNLGMCSNLYSSLCPSVRYWKWQLVRRYALIAPRSHFYSSLCYIYLNYQIIFDISFSGLVEMDLSSNRLRTIPFASTIPSSSPLRHPATHLTALTQLNLADNEIGELTASCLSRCPSLTVLSLRANALTGVHRDAFNATPGLARLDLADNRIVGLDQETYKFCFFPRIFATKLFDIFELVTYVAFFLLFENIKEKFNNFTNEQ